MFQFIPTFWWTGGHDLAVEGNWKWIKSSQPVEDFVWSYSQPDGYDGHDCLDLFYGYDYRGDDESCENLYFPICQIN